MLRVLIFILWIVFFAAALTLLFSIRSAIPVEAFGWRMDIPAGLAILAALAFAALVALGTSVIKDMTGAPKAARAKKELQRRERGVLAITKGFAALAAGDAAMARREAQTAEKALGPVSATRLLAAQAAELSGDGAAAGEAFKTMLDEPETELIALRGLYATATREGDIDAARRYAERAFDRKPDARWAFDAAFDLALRISDFAAAGAALERAAKSKTIDQPTADRGLAATLAAGANASHAAGDPEGALQGADAALRYAPDFTPAAILSARLHAGRADLKKADRILSTAFATAPSRAVAEAFADIFKHEGAAAFDRLAAKNPESREAVLLRARALLLRGDSAAAAGELAAALRSSAEPRALLLMAEAQSAQSGDGAARPWLLRAASAPRDDDPPADAFFRFTGEGWRQVIRNFMEEGRLAPAPLQSPLPGLTDDELGSLTSRRDTETVETDVETGVEPDVESAAVDDRDADEALDREAAAAREVS